MRSLIILALTLCLLGFAASAWAGPGNRHGNDRHSPHQNGLRVHAPGHAAARYADRGLHRGHFRREPVRCQRPGPGRMAVRHRDDHRHGHRGREAVQFFSIRILAVE